jgi:hypothetical protein
MGELKLDVFLGFGRRSTWGYWGGGTTCAHFVWFGGILSDPWVGFVDFINALQGDLGAIWIKGVQKGEVRYVKDDLLN